MTTRTIHRHGDNLDQQFKTRSVELSLLKSVKKICPMMYLTTVERFIAQKLLKVIFWPHLSIPNPLKSHAPKKLFPLFSNIRAETPKLWSLSSPTLVENPPGRQVTHLS